MNKLLKKPNVVAVGKGHKLISGVDTGRNAIVVCVTHKVPINALRKSQIIPLKYRGIETDVIETGEIRALRTTKHRPAPGGVSIGHYAITAGTLGMVVRKDGKRYILSNNHVLANSNDAVMGDSIYQPGPADGGGKTDTIAILTGFVPIEFSGASDCPIGGLVVRVWNFLAELLGRRTRLEATFQGINKVDCALAEPIEGAEVSDEILEVGTPIGFAGVNVGTLIKKSGRTTELTHGAVTITDVEVTVNYGTGTAVFEDQLITSNISAGGDSGSVVLNEDNEVVGLLFAGSDTVTIVNKIDNVINALGLDAMIP